MIIAACRKVSVFDIAIGGKCSKITTISAEQKAIKNEKFGPIIEAAANNFYNDHYGSLNYKRSLIETGLKRIDSTL
jgi:hypothetical protein